MKGKVVHFAVYVMCNGMISTLLKPTIMAKEKPMPKAKIGRTFLIIIFNIISLWFYKDIFLRLLSAVIQSWPLK